MANLQYFSTPYQTLITGSGATKRYVDAALGSNSNNGTSETSAWLTFDYALSQTAATTSEVMIIVNPGTYTVTASANVNASYLFSDGNYARKIVCAPSQVTLQWTATGVRDAPFVDLQNAGSAIYGAILLRNHGGKAATSYTVAVFNGSTANLKGNFYNCVFRETNANQYWSLQYDNGSVISSQVNNCTFYFGATTLSDYSGGAGLVLNNCAFNQANPAGSSTKNNTIYSQSVNATTYLITGVSTAGVASGTYDWSLPYNQTGVSFTVSGVSATSVNEGQTLVAGYTTSTTSTFIANYTITGTTVLADIGIALTGTITVSSGTGSLSIPIIADNAIEGTEYIYVTINNSTAGPITIYDTSAPLTLIPPIGVAGAQYVITLTTSSANGTQYPYTITGTNITTATIGSLITGTFVINNNSATFTLLSGSVAGSTFYVNVPSLGIQQSGVITFTSSTSFTTATIGIQSVFTATLMQSNGYFPITGLSLGQLNSLSLPSTSTYTLTGQNPIPGLSLFQINYQSTSTSTYLITKQNPIPSIMQGSTQPVAPPPPKLTSQADTGYGNTPVTPLGQPLVKEFWL
jgi:hypothetical protein